MPWMTDLYYDDALQMTPRGRLGTRPLRQITLPGTHDSGCYRAQPMNVWSQTQIEDIGQQLAGGIRYFDLRPCVSGTDFWTYHGPFYWGGKLTGTDGILQQIRDYFDGLAPGDRELVILNISHFHEFDNVRHGNLIAAIIAALGPHLVEWTQVQIAAFDRSYTDLLSTPMGNPPVPDPNRVRSRVLVLYDGALDTKIEAQMPLAQLANSGGFFVIAPKYTPPGVANANWLYLFDQYAGSGNIAQVQQDQLNKLRQRQNYDYSKLPSFNTGPWVPNAVHGVVSTLHLFSWTLTPQLTLSRNWNPVIVAQETANPLLLRVFCEAGGWAGPYYSADADPQINIIYVDNYRSEIHHNPGSHWNGLSIAVAIAARMNVGPVGPRDNW